MGKERVSKETLRAMVVEAKAETKTLSVSSAWAHKHLGDKEGQAESQRLDKNIQEVLNHVLRLLDNIYDEDELEDERGMHNAKLETLLEKRDRMNERIEKMRGNNSHATTAR